jgi:choline dehydrogenase-like flavoprotein
MLPAQLGDRHARVGLLDEPDDLLGGESTLLHVRPLGLTDFTASRGMAQWGQVNPAQGVVDANLKVHSMDNLYVAGSSVFVTAGVSNPTFTIITLSIRLADHLAGRFAAGN